MKRILVAAVAALSFVAPTHVTAQGLYLGQIILMGGSYCPRGTISAEGQLLSIAPNPALFSLFGTNFGGDGRTTFGIPDLRGRSPMGQGQGPGLSARAVGQKTGSETTTQTIAQMPPHNHDVTVAINGILSPADTPNPSGTAPAISTTGNIYSTATTGLAPMSNQMATVSQQQVGGGQAMNNIAPVQVIRYCVAIEGIFPPT